MKRVLAIVGLAAGGFFAYRSFSSSGAARAFEKFADAWARHLPPETAESPSGD